MGISMRKFAILRAK